MSEFSLPPDVSLSQGRSIRFEDLAAAYGAFAAGRIEQLSHPPDQPPRKVYTTNEIAEVAEDLERKIKAAEVAEDLERKVKADEGARKRHKNVVR